MSQETQNKFMITVPADQIGQRLDKFLSAELKDQLSRTRIQQLIDEEALTCHGQVITDHKYKIKENDEFCLIIPEAKPYEVKAQDIALNIIYEDKDLIVISKEAGMVVHPSFGHEEGTLVNALLAHAKDSLSGIGGVQRPGIVHRLDKETSGLMIIAKNDLVHQKLSAQFSDRKLSRKYLALVWSSPIPPSGDIITAYGRHRQNRQKMAVLSSGDRMAHTQYKLLKNFHDQASLVECSLKTGRTHQIRVHMSHIGCPIVGEPVYSENRKLRCKLDPQIKEILSTMNRQALHAYEISFYHPTLEKQMDFQIPLSQDISSIIDRLNTLSD